MTSRDHVREGKDSVGPSRQCGSPHRKLRRETIIAAAHLYRLEGSADPRAVPVVLFAPPPARHHNLFALAGGKNPDESGFLTSAGRFVDREEGLKIAIASGQPMIDHPSRNDRYLFSEDLW